MIDLHCHIIPAVDDGAQSAASACRMAEHALRSGVDTIVATPHCNLRGAKANLRGRVFDRRLAMLRALLKQEGIPLTVLPGAEVFAYGAEFRRLLDAGALVTLNRSRYLLMEFPFHASIREISAALDSAARRGYVPVVAHPERYSEVQMSPRVVAQWFARGYVIQANKGSFLGHLGEGSAQTAQWLLRQGLLHVIASDAHDTRYRTTGFASLLPVLERRCPAEYIDLLLRTNPRRIIQDQYIPRPRSLYRENNSGGAL